MITCAINDPKIIRLLYADITSALKSTPDDQTFDHMSYMKDLYADFEEDGSPEVAAKYLQSVPRLIIDAANTYFEDKTVDYAELNKLKKQFRTDTAINDIIDTLGKKEDLEQIKSEILVEKSLKGQLDQVPIAIEGEVVKPNEFKTLSPFGGTLQNYIKINPSEKITVAGDQQLVKIEEINPEMTHIINTFNNMKVAQGMSDFSDGVVYQDKKLYFKPQNLDQFAVGPNYNKLDTSTRANIALSRTIRSGGKKVDPNIAQADQRVILVLSDQFGNPVYADEQGNLVDEKDGGKLVYQFMRVVRKTDKEYTVRDVYNVSDQMISPKEFATKYYNPETDGTRKEYFAKVVAAQQEEMKELYDLQQKILAGDNSLLPITNITTGVPVELSATYITLKDLVNFPGMSDDMLASIETARDGKATIAINGSSFALDRPHMPEEIAVEIATILTDPNIDLNTKKTFTDQFIPSRLDIKGSTKKYQLIYNVEKGFVYFNTFNRFFLEEQTDNKVILTQSHLQGLGAEQLAKYKETIIDYLTKRGLPSQKGQTFMNYTSKNLNSRKYLRLAPNGKGFVTQPYFDLLKQLDSEVALINADPGFYNFVVNFTTPDSLLGNVIENSNKKKTSFKSEKDTIVERLRNEEEITGKLDKDFTKDTLWDLFESSGNRISFYNKTKRKLTDADKGKVVSLLVKDEVVAKDGTVYKDVVEVYLGNEHVGNVAETDYNGPTTQGKPENSTTPTEVRSKAQIIEEITTPGAEFPTDTNSPVAQIFKADGDIDLGSIPGLDELYRKGIKKEFINPVKILKAKLWWKSEKMAPLRKVINFEHVTNLVNSDVFATFIVSGAELADPSGKLATIKVNKANGSFYKNLTSYHESWHVFSQLFLTKEEKLDLYNELRNSTDAKGNQPHLTKSYRDLEEILAEDFRNYVKTGKAKAAAPKRNTLFRRILDALKQFFGKALNKFNKNDIEISSLNSPMAKELFDNLYLGKFNNYQASIDNAMLFSLDRGITQVNNSKQTALSPQDSELVVNSIDSIFSEIIDSIYKKISKNSRKIAIDTATKAGETELTEEVLAKYKPSEKSASIVMLTDTNKRAWMYNEAKKKLEETLKIEQDKLQATSNVVDFNKIKTLAELKSKAVATLKTKSGKDKRYIFLTSQINDYANLTPTLRNGERVKGEDYKDTIKIVGDYYRHMGLSKKGSPADIIVVSRLEDAETQLQNYIKGGAKTYTDVEYNKDAESIIISKDQEIVRDNVRILQQTLANWGDEASGVIKYHSENTDYELAKTKYEVVLDETEDSTETSTNEMNNDTLVGKISLQQMMSKETTYILKSLFKVDENGNTPVNRLGFKERADFAKVFTIVAKAIGGERDRYAAYEKLREESDKFPEIKQLFETKYPDPSNINNVFEYNVSRQFLQDFGKYKVKYLQLFAFTENKSLNFQVKESSLAIDNTLNRWSGKFKSSGKTDYITKTKDNVSVLNLDTVVNKFKDGKGNLNLNDSLAFARAIGIDMENNANINEELSKKADYYGLPYIFDMVKDFNEINKTLETDPNSKELTPAKIKFLEAFKVDPVEVMRNAIPSGILTSLKGTVKELTQLKRLAELQTKYGYDSATTGVIRANGNTGYQEMNWSAAAARVYALNAVTDENQLWTDSRYDYMSNMNPLINTHTRHLKLWNNLFQNGKKIPGKDILLFAQDGFSVANADGTTDGNTTTELDPFSKFLLELHTMSLGGVSELPRTSEKKFSYGIKLSGGIEVDPVGYITKGSDKNLYVDMNMFVPNANKKITGPIFAIGGYMFGYMQGEFDRIKKFRGPDKDNYLKVTGYNRLVNDGNGNDVAAGSVFSAFDSILTQDTKNALYELADQQIDVDLIDYLRDTPLKKQIVADFQNYFNEKTQEIKSLYFNNFGYLSKSMYEKIGYKEADLTNEKYEELKKDDALTTQILKGYLYNDWIHKYETSMLMFGDHAQWNHDKEEWSKRIPGLTSDGIGFLFDQGTRDFINNVFNKNTYASKLGKEYNNFQYNQKLNTAVIKDAVRESIYLDDMKAAWTEEYSKSYDAATVKKLVEKDVDAYTKMKEGDGMAYMTIDAYRTLHQTGRGWSLAQEDLYQKIIKGQEVDIQQVKDYFPVYKLHYFGTLDNDILPATAMHKFAVMPLIPGVNAKEGSQLEVLHKKMLLENTQYVTFESGSKGANLTKDGSVDDIFIDDAKAINQTVDKEGYAEVPFTLNPIYLAGLKEVTVINDHFKKELPIATQTRGIVLDNLYSDGEVINKKKNEPLLNEYLASVKDYTDILKEELLTNIGFELIDGRYVGNLTEFVKIIRKELAQRDTPDHLVKLINTTEDEQLAMDLSLHPESDSIEKLLMSFIQKGLIKQNTNGEPLIQTPTTFTNGLWDDAYSLVKDKKEIKKVLGTNTLPFYIRNKNGRTSEMKVAIALQGEYKKLLKGKDNEGNVIGTLDRLNELLKDPKWFENNRDAVTLFGPRIPNDATNTIEAAAVWHFLPESFGNSIIIPTEIVAKAGSDYDGDKLFMSMANIDNEGNVVKEGIDNFDKVLASTKQLEKEGKLPEGHMTSKQLIRIQKRYLQNRYKNAAIEILMLPENYAYLTKPNGTYLIDKYVPAVEKNKQGYDRYKNPHGAATKESAKNEKGNRKNVMSPSRTFEAVHNLFVHEANLSLEPSLGILAKLTKSHPVYKSVGAKMPATYKLPIYNFQTQKADTKYIGNLITVPMTMRFGHNTVKNKNGVEVISLAGERTQKGTRITDILSHSLQAVLDRAKETFPFDLKLVPEAMDTFSYLIQAGVNEEDIFLFLNQPAVVSYFKYQNLRNSSMYKVLMPAEKGSVKNLSAAQVISDILKEVPKETVTDILNKVDAVKLDVAIKAIQNSTTPEEELIISVVDGKSAKGTVQDLINSLESKKLLPENIKNISMDGRAMYTKTSKLNSTDSYVFATELLSNEYLPNGINQKDLVSGLETRANGNLKALAIFMNFVELEKQFAGMKEVQSVFSPDTAKLTTVQQVLKRIEAYKELESLSNVDQDFLNKLIKDSVISSFNQDELIKQLIVPLFNLRLDKDITKFIKDTLSDYTTSRAIKKKFGMGIDGEERFTNVFNNSIINFIYQNYRSNSSNGEGKLVNIPESYSNLEVVIDDTASEDVIVTDDKIIVNTLKIETDYANQVYLTNSTAPNNYQSRQLDTFTLKQNPFTTLASYYRYVIARETIRVNNPAEELNEQAFFIKKSVQLNSFDAAYESYISEKALKSVFNHQYIMGKTKYSYSETVMNVINEFEILKADYPILTQLALAPNTEGVKVIQLNNKKEAEGLTASNYYKQLRNLADVTIRKVDDEDNNKRISEIFEAFSLMMYYQHGVGGTKLGFVKVLDPGKRTKLMAEGDSPNFMNNYLNSTVLNTILTKVLDNQRFKNFTVEPEKFRHNAAAILKATVDEGEIETFDSEEGESNLVKGEVVVFQEDVNAFNTYVKKANGKRPQNFFTPISTFSKFYNSATGKREIMPQSARWELQSNGLYDMIDQDPESGEVYYENVDLSTGTQMVDPNAPKVEQPVEPSNNVGTTELSTFTNHSGGAAGSDTQWDVIGKDFGMVNNKHYFTGVKGPGNAPLGNVDITNNPIAVQGASKVAQAAKQMWGYKYNTMKDQRLIRNWAQVANSDAVFAIGTLGKEGDIWKGDEKSTEPRKLLKFAVQGGTGYAVEMAIQAGKPVYVFDQIRNQWYQNINNEWSKTEVPVLTKNFAGIGTREINEAGKQAIKDVYENTLSQSTTQPSNDLNEFIIADTLPPIEQNFTDGQGGRQMQDKFKGKSTMDLIISGDRTRTTRAKTDIQRMAKDYGLSKISDLVGKVIRMTDKTGKEVYTRITKVAPFTQEYQDSTWQKEGWKKEVTDKNVGNYPYAIEFKVVTPSGQPSATVVKEGVSELFKSNPELANIGTQDQYSQYLDSIFPNSKVKEVLYHMTSTAGKKGIEQKGRFLKPGEQGYQKSDYVTTGGIYFTDNNFYDEDTQMYGSPISGGYGSAYVSAILNIKNPLIDLNKSFGDISQVELKNYDGFVGTNEAKEIGVLEPEQIHILGNKQDIANFKKFVAQSTVKSQLDTNDYSISEDMAVFNNLVEANKGALPKTFTVGKRNWILNPFGNYDSVDSETGEIYIRNANMQTGIVEMEPGLNEPISPEIKAAGLEYLEMIDDASIEKLAELGYDIKDLINNLAKAKTVEDYNKVQEILNKLC